MFGSGGQDCAVVFESQAGDCLVEENNAIQSPSKTSVMPVSTPVGIVCPLFQQKCVAHLAGLFV